jgi:Ras association domain-containing protein 3
LTLSYTLGIAVFCIVSQWEAFSLPELQNFLRILDKEEDEQLQNLKRRYTAYRHKLEEALSEVWKPG